MKLKQIVAAGCLGVTALLHAGASTAASIDLYSMLDIPAPSEFPGTGDKGNKMPDTMKSQAQWVDTVKNMCQSCHALGSRGIREVPKTFMDGNDSHTAWALRTQAGQAMEYMAVPPGTEGPANHHILFSPYADP